MRQRMSRWGIPLLLILILTACGGTTPGQPAVPAGQGSAQPGFNMPLPESEKTRIAVGTAYYITEAAFATSAPVQTTPAPGQLLPVPATGTNIPSLASKETQAAPVIVVPQAPTIIAPVIGPSATVPPTARPSSIPGQENSSQDLPFLLADATTIIGTLYLPPEGEPPYAGAILIPMHVENRQDWAPIAHSLAQAGIAALTIDLRSQGGSGGQPDWYKAVSDVESVWKDFRSRAEIDPARTILIGSSIGANIAINVAASHPEIHAAVLLSPSQNIGGIDTTTAVETYGERPLLIITSEDDPLAGNWPAWILSRHQEIYTLKAYPGNAHGSYLFTNKPRLVTYIIDWLQPRIEAAEIPAEPAAPQRKPALLWIFSGLACLAGVLLLFIAIALIINRFRSRTAAGQPMKMTQMAGQNGWGDVSGKITEVPDPIGELNNQPIAAIRLRAEQRIGVEEWEEVFDHQKATNFYFNDGSETAFVEPHDGSIHFIDDGKVPSNQELEAALNMLQVEHPDPQNQNLRFRLWALQPDRELMLTAMHQTLTRINLHTVAAQRPETQQVYALSALQPVGETVWTRGRVTLLHEAAQLNGRPLAYLRLHIEENHPEFGWSTIFDGHRSARFFLADENKRVMVIPPERKLDFDHQGNILEGEIPEELLQIFEIEPLEPGKNYRVTTWDIGAGDAVWLSGEVQSSTLLRANEADLDVSRIPLRTINSLGSNHGMARLSGRIVEVPEPLDDDAESPLAVIRLVVEEATEDGWRTLYDETKASRFRLQDETGSLWVLPANLHPNHLGEGANATSRQAESALLIQDGPLNLTRKNNVRYKIWELRRYQHVTLAGNFYNLPVLVAGDERTSPFNILSSGTDWRKLLSWHPRREANILFILITFIGLVLSCAGCVGLINVLQAWLA